LSSDAKTCPTWSKAEVLARLKGMRNETNRAGMARFGINTQNAYGISIRDLRPLAKAIGRDHNLALQLWRTGIHEARILASFIDAADKVSEEQIDAWVADFDSWDLCDQVMDLFIATPFANAKIHIWASAEPEFVKRAAFAMIAGRAVRQKKLPDETFLAYLDLIEAQAGDPRNYVKKAVNWALRQIGKRSATLHPKALALAQRLAASDDRARRWIGRDAARELTSDAVIRKLDLA
jgi:3-methyladenine DNA glycosylase AlkD